MSDDTPKPFALSASTRDAGLKKAQNLFTASQRRDAEARKEIATQQEASATKIAKLRALRLAKEEQDRQESAPLAPSGKKTGKKTARAATTNKDAV